MRNANNKIFDKRNFITDLSKDCKGSILIRK